MQNNHQFNIRVPNQLWTNHFIEVFLQNNLHNQTIRIKNLSTTESLMIHQSFSKFNYYYHYYYYYFEVNIKVYAIDESKIGWISILDDVSNH